MNGEHILIAEDSKTQAEQLAHILEIRGYDVSVAANGEEALAAARKRKPRLVISDVLMPVMDGYAMCRAFKDDGGLKTIPVIILSTLSDPSDVIMGIEAGVDYYLTKPYQAEHLLSKVATVLAEPRPQANDGPQEDFPVALRDGQRTVKSTRQRIMNLLLSTYENAVWHNRELIGARNELRSLNEKLEEMVEARTAALTTEIAERKLAEALAHHLNRVLRSIRNVSQLIVHEKDPKRLIEKACGLLIESRGYHGAWIAIASDEGTSLEMAGTGWDESFEPFARGIKEGSWPTCRGKALASSQGLVILDPSKDCAGCPLRGSYHDSMAVAAALQHDKRNVGLLVISAPSGLVVDGEEQSLLIEVAGDLALAVHGIESERRRRESEEALHRIEWLLTRKPGAESQGEPQAESYAPSYGDLTVLNTDRAILDAIGAPMLTDIMGDYLDMLETSCAVYERNGDYALGIFSSDWCRFMDRASRALCGTADNREALSCGKWLCHESCWKKASKRSIEEDQAVDIECDGGIRLYAVPIRTESGIIGSINFGYGDPPRDMEKLRQLAVKYDAPVEELVRRAGNYESRPPFTIELAKKRLESSARLIAEIAERKRAEEEVKTMTQHLLQAAKFTTLGELAASVAHELNNPLATASMRIESLQVGLAENDPRKLSLVVVENEIDRMARLVADLLQFSRRNNLEISTLDVREEIEKTLDLIYYRFRTANVDVRKVFAPDVRMVLADRQQLRQVFLNLFSNAADAMPAGGTLVIRVSMADPPAWVICEVTDTGVGIPAEILPKVVEPFFTTKPAGKGTGLGLPICRRIVKEHHGEFHIASEVGKGTTISIRLPVTGGGEEHADG